MAPPAGSRASRLAVHGRVGERAAAAWLEARGYRVLARNVRSRFGEIDLVARQAGLVVFVEVKARIGQGFGHPSEAVVARKQRRLARLAARFLQANGLGSCPVRFDAVAVLLGPRGQVVAIEHIPDAFQVEGAP
ncbi:MAG: YraN family protein [Armatimonadota bacterium]|nr:YraN family protein [Armatimonadota bacterium]